MGGAEQQSPVQRYGIAAPAQRPLRRPHRRRHRRELDLAPDRPQVETATHLRPVENAVAAGQDHGVIAFGNVTGTPDGRRPAAGQGVQHLTRPDPQGAIDANPLFPRGIRIVADAEQFEIARRENGLPDDSRETRDVARAAGDLAHPLAGDGLRTQPAIKRARIGVGVGEQGRYGIVAGIEPRRHQGGRIARRARAHAFDVEEVGVQPQKTRLMHQGAAGDSGADDGDSPHAAAA